MYSVQFNSNPAQVTNMSMNVFNESDGMSKLNATGFITNDLLRIVISFVLNRKPDGKHNDLLLLNTNFDTCKVQHGTLGNFMAKMLSDQMHQYSNYKFECPLKKGWYFINAFPINLAMDYIPRQLMGIYLGKRLEWEASLSVKGKTSKSSSLVHIFTMKIHGFTLYY
jgi:Protein of unknown function (DUF1091)